ncbi:MAG: aldehyde dehydrogenase family protein [Acidimicrobiales bacterium]
MSETLEQLVAGTPIIFGGNRMVRVTPELADAFRPGDRLLVSPADGALLHIPASEAALVALVVGDAVAAFTALEATADAQITAFFNDFAERLADEHTFAPIAAANAADVEAAVALGRSTTRLELRDSMRADMIAGLRGWAATPSGRGAVIERVEGRGFTVENRRAGLGVVGFVFEGRPNVFADACGVLRSGNAVVFRIGRDALGTARAIVTHALAPALGAAGLPAGAVGLVDSPAHAAGWALFADARLALAVARGSGTAVAQLGAVARQAGIPVSLHGTGGAWMVVSAAADGERVQATVQRSLDRKVCNTLNVCVVTADAAPNMLPGILAAADGAAHHRQTVTKFHVTAQAAPYLAERLGQQVEVVRADGTHQEAWAELIDQRDLGTEWEWEHSPELSVVVVEDLAAAIALCNRYSPRLVATLLSEDATEQARFYAEVDTPFVGDGFTRWVDGQYAFERPELGLSNWEGGRLFGRGAVLSGDSVFTVRTHFRQHDPHLQR